MNLTAMARPLTVLKKMDPCAMVWLFVHLSAAEDAHLSVGETAGQRQRDRHAEHVRRLSIPDSAQLPAKQPNFFRSLQAAFTTSGTGRPARPLGYSSRRQGQHNKAGPLSGGTQVNQM